MENRYAIYTDHVLRSAWSNESDAAGDLAYRMCGQCWRDSAGVRLDRCCYIIDRVAAETTDRSRRGER